MSSENANPDIPSTIAAKTAKEMLGRAPLVNSSLAAAAAAGSSLRAATTVPVPSDPPQSSLDLNQYDHEDNNQSAGSTNLERNNNMSPPSHNNGASSLAAAAGIASQTQTSHSQPPPVPQQHQQISYQDSHVQMQMHHNYQAQAPYRHGHVTQHHYPHTSPMPPTGMHSNHAQDYHQHPTQVSFSSSKYPELAGGFASGSEQGSESLGLGASQHDSSVEASGEGDDAAEAPVKLFVGQVPKSMDEADLTRAFQEYGEIKEILIIRDRHTGQHRGCAFVTFNNAADAAKVQETLHDKFTFPEGRKPVQIKPASEPSNSLSSGITPEQENKLFIGMTSRNADEDSIRELFAPFGEIREIYIIRNADGSNKGCAFLKYIDNDSALNAIETLNDNFTMEGATRPLIVKFADTKAQRKARTSANARLYGGHRRMDQPGMHSPQAGYYLGHGPVPVYHNYPHTAPSMGMPTHYSQTPYSGSYPQGTPPPHSYMYPQHPYAQTSPYGYPPPAGPYGHTDGSPVPSSSASYEGGSTGGSGVVPPNLIHTQPRSSLASRQQHSMGVPRPHKPYPRQEMSGGVNPRPREGPAGANLFIYHLPHDLTDADLATAFNPFGNVISAKVYVDKFTGESKGFGFVSYDSVISAEQAIEQMNGFQIGSKRLKVQHKRVSKPPTGQPPSSEMEAPPIPLVHQDPNMMMGALHAPLSHHTQPLPTNADVDNLTGELQVLDVQYTENEE